MTEKDEFNIRIGENIRAARVKCSFTQEELAESMGLSTQFVSDMERGKSGISLITLSRLCDVLHVSSDYILGRYQEELDALALEKRIAHLSPEHKETVESVLEALLKTLH